jgi:hypothetical protein
MKEKSLIPSPSFKFAKFRVRVLVLKEVFLLASSLVIFLHNPLFPSTHSANTNANT